MQTDRKFLIVDDDEDDLEFFREVMKDIYPDVACDLANDCEEAMTRLRSETGTVPEGFEETSPAQGNPGHHLYDLLCPGR